MFDFAAQRKTRVQDSPNLTPLIDVVFILLIFFMLTSTFRIDRGIDVSLPSSETAEQQPNKDSVFTVSIANNGDVYVEKKLVPIKSLTQRVKLFLEKFKDGKIVLNSDARVPVQTLITVMDMLKKAQATNITLAATGMKE